MLFAPFLFIYVLICVALLAGLFILIELEVISYAFLALGLSPRAAILALFASLIGSYINIPLYTVPSDAIPTATTVNNFGVLYQIPMQYAGSSTTVAINVGGALIPFFICAYGLFRWPSALLPSVLGTAIVACVAHQFAYGGRTRDCTSIVYSAAYGSDRRGFDWQGDGSEGQPARDRVRQWRPRHADRS